MTSQPPYYVQYESDTYECETECTGPYHQIDKARYHADTLVNMMMAEELSKGKILILDGNWKQIEQVYP